MRARTWGRSTGAPCKARLFHNFDSRMPGSNADVTRQLFGPRYFAPDLIKGRTVG
jgi:hypothetical protein